MVLAFLYCGAMAETTSSRSDVEFTSNGATLRGWLYPGLGEGPRPAVVMAHGLSAVKEMFLDDYAEQFAKAGLTTLVYDHFGFGASDGEPRQSPSSEIQMQGYRDAIAWVADQDGVDPSRIGLWGSSFSGGMVVTLASEDLPIGCVVAQVPNLDASENKTPAGAVAVIMEALESGDQTATVKAVTPEPDGDGIMFADGAHDWFTSAAADRAPNWRNELLIAGLVSSGGHTPVSDLPNARVPLLLLVAPDDVLTPPGNAIDSVEPSEMVVVREIPGGHFDAYEKDIEISAGAAVSWFREHLAP